MPTTAETIDRFEERYQRYNGLTTQRIRRQQNTLRAFADHAGKTLDVCDSADFSSWMSSLVESGLHPNTVRTKGNMIRPFFTWAYQEKIIDAETLMSVKMVKNPKGSSGRTLPKPYTAKDLKRWRKELDARYPLLEDYRIDFWKNGRTKHYKRVADYSMRLQIEAIVGLALQCGLRRAEIFGCTVDDIHPDNAYVVVSKGKGGKPREVPHTKRSREVIGAWLEWREVLLAPHPDQEAAAGDRPWLSLAANQPALTWLKPMLWGRFQELLTTVGEWRLHRFRHTCATNWLRAGMDLHVISRLLGHASVNQTLCYAEIVRDDIQRQVEKHEDQFESQINGG